tara:strand:- start:278 stop:382 length:105 start_codon:yes stop_codon:yes gene_type:complete
MARQFNSDQERDIYLLRLAVEKILKLLKEEKKND